MTVLHLDFETRSTCDLRKTGVFVYAGHPTTDAWCMMYAFDDEPVEEWHLGDELPQRIIDHLHAGGEFHAHNAQFEWAIWNAVGRKKYGWPFLPVDQMVCTAAMAAAMSFPRALAQVAIAIRLPIEKDMEGHTLMMRMSRPRSYTEDGKPIWWDVPERLERLYAYCRNDVEVERALEKKLAPLSNTERQVWQMDQRINARGVKVDVISINAMTAVIEGIMPKFNKRLKELTGGKVIKFTQVAHILAWVKSRGIETDTLDKEALADLLGSELPDDVRELLEIRADAGKASIAKLVSMIEGMSADERLRGIFLYNAASTGRFSALRVQLHNMPRSKIKPEMVALALEMFTWPEAVAALELCFGSVIHLVSDCLRGLLIPADGHRFLAADFANIEGRVLAVLAGQQDLIEMFERDGPVYEDMAAAIFRKDVKEITADGEERQLGKKAVLGCGFGMGWKKFHGTCKKEGMAVTEELAQLAVDTYRSKNDRVKSLWYEMEAAALEAVRRPGEIQTLEGFPDYGIRFVMKKSLLICRLPSGRKLYYPYPVIRKKRAPWGDMKDALHCQGVNSVTRRFEEYNLYGGLAVENIVQATARDLLVEAMLRAEPRGYPVVVHVHDEIVCEVPDGQGNIREFEALVSELPAWAKGWPVKAKGWEGRRYRK